MIRLTLLVVCVFLSFLALADLKLVPVNEDDTPDYASEEDRQREHALAIAYVDVYREEAKDMRSESWDKQRAIVENYRRETEDMPAARLAGKLVDMEDEFGKEMVNDIIHVDIDRFNKWKEQYRKAASEKMFSDLAAVRAEKNSVTGDAKIKFVAMLFLTFGKEKARKMQEIVDTDGLDEWYEKEQNRILAESRAGTQGGSVGPDYLIDYFNKLEALQGEYEEKWFRAWEVGLMVLQ